jgi:hypothetical protein
MGKKTVIQLAVALLIVSPCLGGTWANITVDGNFADWVDVPLVASDPLDNASGVDIADIKVANDDNYIYVYMTLHAAADPFSGSDHYFIDGDGVTSTGFQVFGGALGSEILLQGASAYQEASGTFNDGPLPGGTVLQAPFGTAATEFEFSIDRNVVGVAAPFVGLSLITSSHIGFLFWQNNGVQDTVQFNYTMASEPPCPGPPTTYRTIVIDGDFADWTNIPAVAVDPVDAGSGAPHSGVHGLPGGRRWIQRRITGGGHRAAITVRHAVDRVRDVDRSQRPGRGRRVHRPAADHLEHHSSVLPG